MEALKFDTESLKNAIASLAIDNAELREKLAKVTESKDTFYAGFKREEARVEVLEKELEDLKTSQKQFKV